jgi:hypothetical protein
MFSFETRGDTEWLSPPSLPIQRLPFLEKGGQGPQGSKLRVKNNLKRGVITLPQSSRQARRRHGRQDEGLGAA